MNSVFRPLRVLFLAFLFPAATLAQTDRAHQLAAQAADQVTTDCSGVSSVSDCHDQKPTGCSNSAKPRYDAYLNFLKNQPVPRDTTPVRTIGINDFVSLEEKVPPDIKTHHSQFATDLSDLGNGLGEGNVYAVVGFLYFVENTALSSQHRGETCNCQLKTNDAFDFHLGIGFDPTLANEIRTNPPAHDVKNPGPMEQTSIVAEMTPHTRPAKWTVVRLNRQRGKQIKVVGQLMLDNQHANTRDDCSFIDDPEEACWRATVWEIHPVTQFFVCKTGITCSVDSPDSDWIKLEDLP